MRMKVGKYILTDLEDDRPAEEEIVRRQIDNYMLLYSRLLNYYDDIPLIPELICVDQYDSMESMYLESLIRAATFTGSDEIFWNNKVYAIDTEFDVLTRDVQMRVRCDRLVVFLGQPHGDPESHTFSLSNAEPIFIGFSRNGSPRSYDDVVYTGVYSADDIMLYAYHEWMTKLLRFLMIDQRLFDYTPVRYITMCYPMSVASRATSEEVRQILYTGDQKLTLDLTSSDYIWQEVTIENLQDVLRKAESRSVIYVLKDFIEQHGLHAEWGEDGPDPAQFAAFYTFMHLLLKSGYKFAILVYNDARAHCGNMVAVVLYTVTVSGTPFIHYLKQSQDIAKITDFPQVVYGEVNDLELYNDIILTLLCLYNSRTLLIRQNLNDYGSFSMLPSHIGNTFIRSVVYRKIDFYRRGIKGEVGLRAKFKPTSSFKEDDVKHSES